jgi:hypothetical protein
MTVQKETAAGQTTAAAWKPRVVVVPREPTAAMMRAAWDDAGLPTDDGILAAEALAARIWTAMLEAAENGE